jgi:hypothetical protein
MTAKTTMASTTPARTIMNRATKAVKRLADSLFTEEEMKEFYPNDGDMEHLWTTWREARADDELEEMLKDLEERTTAETIYEECAEVDDANYGHIDHRVFSARYHEHLSPYKVGVYRVLGFCDDDGRNPESDHVLTNEENYIADVLFERVGEYIEEWMLKKVKAEIATKEE